MQAAANLDARHAFATEFPQGGFGNAIKTACQIIANPSGVAVVRLSLSGFDTHGGQSATQARLLGELARGIVALKAALDRARRWNDTLILTYAEFGRRPRENLSGGTDHGTANVHFALGGRVAGGFYGEAPALDRLAGDGNLGLRDRLSRGLRDRARALVGLAVRSRCSPSASRRCRSSRPDPAGAPPPARASAAGLNAPRWRPRRR